MFRYLKDNISLNLILVQSIIAAFCLAVAILTQISTESTSEKTYSSSKLSVEVENITDVQQDSIISSIIAYPDITRDSISVIKGQRMKGYIPDSLLSDKTLQGQPWDMLKDVFVVKVNQKHALNLKKMLYNRFHHIIVDITSSDQITTQTQSKLTSYLKKGIWLLPLLSILFLYVCIVRDFRKHSDSLISLLGKGNNFDQLLGDYRNKSIAMATMATIIGLILCVCMFCLIKSVFEWNFGNFTVTNVIITWVITEIVMIVLITSFVSKQLRSLMVKS